MFDDFFMHDVLCSGVEKTYRFVHNDDCSGAQASLSLEETVKVHQHLCTDVLGNKGGGGATGDNSQQVVPTSTHTTYQMDGRVFTLSHLNHFVVGSHQCR